MVFGVESEVLDESEDLSGKGNTVSRLLVLARRPRKVFRYDIN